MKLIENAVEFEESLKTDKLVLVDFFGTWCGPCKVMNPILEQISNENVDKLSVIKVDVDMLPELATEFKIRAIPTLLFFKDGEIVEKHVGAAGKNAIESKFNSFI